MTMTTTRAIVAPLIDASLTPPTAAHTPLARALASDRGVKRDGAEEEWKRK